MKIVNNNNNIILADNKTLHGHSGAVYLVVALSKRRLASISDGRSIKVWNVETGEEIRTLTGHSVYSLAVLSDGNRLASGSFDATIKIWW